MPQLTKTKRKTRDNQVNKEDAYIFRVENEYFTSNSASLTTFTLISHHLCKQTIKQHTKKRTNTHISTQNNIYHINKYIANFNCTLKAQSSERTNLFLVVILTSHRRTVPSSPAVNTFKLMVGELDARLSCQLLQANDWFETSWGLFGHHIPAFTPDWCPLVWVYV